MRRVGGPNFLHAHMVSDASSRMHLICYDSGARMRRLDTPIPGRIKNLFHLCNMYNLVLVHAAASPGQPERERVQSISGGVEA